MRVLILGGTKEARELAAALDGRGIAVTTSLAGRTVPARIAGAVRAGGFGGPEGLARALDGFDALIDATHPFAARMSTHAVRAAGATGTALLRLERPRWEADPAWRRAPSLHAAAGMIDDPRVFLTMGETEPFAHIEHAWFLIRCINPPRTPPLHHELLLARGPFTLAGERALLRHHAIGLLVTKDSGGPAPKLQAARELDLPVLMIDRPQTPPATTVTTVQEALQWVVSRLHAPGTP